jgi:hypothetical protein
VHLAFAQHQVVMTHGLASESFYPGPQALRTLGLGPLEELASLFPGLTATSSSSSICGPYGPTVRPFARFKMLSTHLRDLRTGLAETRKAR